MNIKKKQQSLIKNPIFWVVLVVVLVLIAVALEKTGITNFINPVATDGPTPAQQKEESKASAEKKKSLVEQETKADPYTTANPNETSRRIDISAKQEANGTVTVFTKLYGYSDGTCKLDVSNGTKSASQTAESMYQPEYASCAGFSVPIDPLGKGVWTIKLSVSSGSDTKDKTITIEVK